MNNKSMTGDASLKKLLSNQQLIVFIVLVALFVFFCIASPTFRSYSTILSIFGFSYYICLMAIGVTFPLITAGVDLSIGTGIICFGLIGGNLVVNHNLPVWVGIIVTVLVGTCFGVLNGVLTSVFNLPPFIATLGSSMIARGIGSIAVNNVSITWPTGSSEGAWFRSIFRYKLESGTMIPLGFLWIVILVVIMTLVLNKSSVGRYIIAIGSNKEATRLSGINVVKYQILAYVICGTFAGMAAVAYSATFQALPPGTGAGLELDAIGAAIIGGTSMTGGVGTVPGTLIGVFIFSMLKTGLPFIGLQANWQQIIQGLVILVAVTFDVLKNKKNQII